MTVPTRDDQSADMFRPPINRAMKSLDRSFFRKEVPIAAARVLEKTQISRLRTDLHHDILNVNRVSVIKDDPIKKGFKSILLRPEIKSDGINTLPLVEEIRD